MHIQQKEEGSKGMFYIEENGSKVAELVYNIPSAQKIVIEHTEVDESLSGKGIGKQLVQAVADHARSKDIKIIPQCSFAKSVFDQVPEWQDVLFKK